MIGFTSIAWQQLKYQKLRLLAATLGIGFAVILIFIQLGFKEALLSSAVKLHRVLDYDLAMVSPTTDIITNPTSFARNRLFQIKGMPSVETITPVYIGQGRWRSPFEPSMTRTILVIGFNPSEPGFKNFNIDHRLNTIKLSDRVLFDRDSREEYGPVHETVEREGQLRVEVNDREVWVKGTYSLGISFGFEGSMITSDLNFRRIFDRRKKSNIDLGLIGLEEGVDPGHARNKIAAQIPGDVLILTREELMAKEVRYWNTSTSIGYIFNFGVVMGFIVGCIIVYQILFSEVQDHLHEYATLKAMGYTHLYLSGVVLYEAVILALLGFIPAAIISSYLYVTVAAATQLPIGMTTERWITVLALTIAMSGASALVALRKMRSIDPAEVF